MISYHPAFASPYPCAHCNGDGVLEDGDSYEPGYGLFATVSECETCEGTGVALINPDLSCACGECAVFPPEQRYTLAPLPVTW